MSLIDSEGFEVNIDEIFDFILLHRPDDADDAEVAVTREVVQNIVEFMLSCGYAHDTEGLWYAPMIEDGETPMELIVTIHYNQEPLNAEPDFLAITRDVCNG
jgi:hypothetical protein